MALSYTSSQRRPFQGECRRRSRLSMVQLKVRFSPSLPPSPFTSVTSTILQLLPLQRGIRKRPPRTSHSIPKSTQISIIRNQTPSTPTWFTTNSGLVASLIRRPDRQRGMLLRSTPLPTTGPTSTSTTSSPPLVHSLKGISSSPPTNISPGSPTPPHNPAC